MPGNEKVLAFPVYPGVTLLDLIGPLTVLARAIDRDPDLPGLVQRLVCVGGAWREGRHQPQPSTCPRLRSMRRPHSPPLLVARRKVRAGPVL